MNRRVAAACGNRAPPSVMHHPHHPPHPPQPGLPNPEPDVPLVPPAGDEDPSQPDEAPGEDATRLSTAAVMRH